MQGAAERTFTVEGAGKRRLDAFLSGNLPEASRARLQASCSGLVLGEMSVR